MPEIIDKYHEQFSGDPVALNEEVKFEKKDLPNFPERTPVNNELNSREQEILELERELAKKRMELGRERDSKSIENKEQTSEKKEVTKEVTKGSIEETDSGILSSKTSSKIKAQIKRIKEMDRESQVKELCVLSFSEDLDFAVNVAKGLDDAYIIDEFHDTLVDDLYDKLIEEDKLKKI